MPENPNKTHACRQLSALLQAGGGTKAEKTALQRLCTDPNATAVDVNSSLSFFRVKALMAQQETAQADALGKPR